MSENQFDAPDNVDVIDDPLEKFFSDKEYFSDNNQFVGVVLVDSINLPEELLSIQTTKHTIHIYSAIPLYKEELEFKLEHGVTKLLEKFDAIEVDEIVDINRANICA